MKKLHLMVILILLPFYISSGQQIKNYVSNQMIVQFDPSANLSKLKMDYSNINLKTVKLLSRRLNIWLVEFDDAKIESESALIEMKSQPQVKRAQFNHYISDRTINGKNGSGEQNSTLLSPNDTRFSEQWGLHNTGQNGGTIDADIDAPEAWDVSSDAVTALGDQIVMAIIDSQFDLAHTELNFFTNTNEIAGNGIDDDHNGYIDDYSGWNAYNSTGTLPTPVTNSHGTMVSGIAGAKTNNGKGIASISWGAKILPIAGSSATEAVVVEAYSYAYEMRALYNETNGLKGAYIVVTNTSFGVDQGDPDDYPIWCAMYNTLGTIGVLSIGGAPNSNWNVDVVGDIPTACTSEYLITVTNTDNKDLLNTTAGYGNVSIDLGAPGTNILTTIPTDAYFVQSGTSVSVPFVTGTIALMYSAASSSLLTQYKPHPDQLASYMRTFLLSNVDAKTSLRDITVTGGRLNASRAVTAATVVPDAIAPTQITDLAISTITSNGLLVTFTSPMDASVFGAIGYDIRYSTNPISNNTDFQNATQFAYDKTPKVAGRTEQILIDGLNFGTGYYIVIKSYDLWGNYSEISNAVLGNTWGVPQMDVDPLSMLKLINQGVTVLDTISISNTTAYSSTLDYDVQLQNNTFPARSVNLKIKPVINSALLKEQALPKGTESSIPGQSIYGSGGPDSFGYEWIDSDDPTGPAYVWDDIATTGTEVTSWTLSDGSSSATDDGYAGPFNIGFGFGYYSKEFTNVYINTNGLVMFTPYAGTTTTNSLLPLTSPPNGFIAPVWGDLDGSQSGHVYYQQKGDKFIIQFTKWRYFNTTNLLTFQVVLCQNRRIFIYYNRTDNSNNKATVGIESPDGATGLLVAINSTYIKPNLALLYSADPDWIAASNLSGTLLNGSVANVEIELNSVNLPIGNYSMDAVITSNDPANLSTTVKIEMIVSTSGTITRNVELNSGWNIISIPVLASNMSVSTLFPTASSLAYKYDGVYTQVTNFTNGEGYWLKFDSDQTIGIPGTVNSHTVAVKAGWNIIGPFERYVDVSKITTTPVDILTSYFYGFDGVYVAENLLEPGKGYWIKASQDGVINYSAATSQQESYATKDLNEETLSNALVEIPIVVFDGVSASKINLFAGIDPSATNAIDESLGEMDLPPFNPGFEARFVSTESANYSSSYRDYRPGSADTKGDFTHILNYKLGNESNGLRLNFTIPSGVTMNIRDLSGGSIINQTFNAGTYEFSDPATAGLSGLKIILTYDGTHQTVELTSFSAVSRESDVLLSWNTAMEISNEGFEIERKTENGNWQKISFVEGRGTTSDQSEYSYSDNIINVSGKAVSYRLKQICKDGSINYSDDVSVEIVPKQYTLEQNYPNPFNPTTTIRYALPYESTVKLSLYNMLGEKVQELVNFVQPAGYYEVNWNASGFASGIYFYVIETKAANDAAISDFRSIKKMLLVK